MLHASETWPVTKPCLQRLQRNDRAMIRQICNVKPQDTATIQSSELLARLGIEDLDLILKERRLRWYGHVECSNGAVKTAFDIQVNGKRGPERPKMTWKQLTERDRPSAFSRRAVVSYWRKYVQEVLVNRLGGLNLPRKSVVRLTDRPDMTLDVYRGRKTTIQQQREITESGSSQLSTLMIETLGDLV